MNCNICGRGHEPQKLPFICAVDARNSIFEGRMKNIQLILENEGLQKDIAEATPSSTKGNLEESQRRQLLSKDRTDQILASAQKLRDDIKAAKDDIQEKKRLLARRRSAMASDSQGLAERRSRQHKDVEKSTNIAKYRWSQTAEDMASTRKFLCAEAAQLYGLKRISRGGSKPKFEYHLGGLPVLNLMDLNSLSPEVITTSLSHITHILRLASHYLTIRLPAEIMFSRRDDPLPTIYTVPSSYQPKERSAPDSQSASNSRLGPKERPLFLHKPLALLLKDDPSAYSFFLEGVTLLAYNVAWLCCSQGVFSAGKNVDEDICHIGPNLYRLLIDEPTRLQQKSNTTDHDVDVTNWIGRYSHGTLYYPLAGADGTELIRAFNLPSPIKLTDKLRRKLIGDAPAPDWEYLEDDAWKVDMPTESLIVESQQSPVTKIEATTVAVPPKKEYKGWARVMNL